MPDDLFINHVPIITHLKTPDCDELAELARGWDEEYIQLKKGVFEMELNLIQIGSFQFIEQFSKVPILYRGKTPQATFALAIPVLNPGKSLYGGNILQKDCCLLGSETGYLDLKTSDRHRLFLMTAPIEQILAQAEQMQRPLTQKQLSSPGILLPEPLALKRLSDYLTELLLLAKTYPDKLTNNFLGNSMAELILKDSLPLLVDVLTSNSNFLPEKNSNRQKLVKYSEAFMEKYIAAPITLTDLCRELKTSQRSLYYAFQEYLGLPPMAYLKLLRLRQVRRALKSNTFQISKVSDIATSYGFWHMGQFSQDYKKMFGESPSTTLRKNLFIL